MPDVPEESVGETTVANASLGKLEKDGATISIKEGDDPLAAGGSLAQPSLMESIKEEPEESKKSPVPPLRDIPSAGEDKTRHVD